MDNREILNRFKNGTLDRQRAAALLTGAAAEPPPVPAQPTPAVAPPVAPPPGRDGATVPAAGTERTDTERTGPEPAGAELVGPGRPKAQAPDPRCAVIGIAGRYPGAPGLEAFWQNTLGGRDTAATVPPGRARYVADDQAGLLDQVHLLDGVDEFDPEFFQLTERDGIVMDPQERLFLETAWQTLEGAGYTGARLETLTAADGEPRSVGVYAAVSSADYALLAAERWAEGGRDMPRSGHWSLPGRLSALLDLRGPSQPVDTAQSSFLVALHLALTALAAGECAAALVGGVDLRLHPSRHRPGAGEGVGAVLLKPLAAAEADGDTIHAVVRSSAVGHTGRLGGGDRSGSSDRTDDSDRLARRTLEAAGVEAGSVSLHETSRTTADGIGDAGAATGVAALTRAVLQLREATRAPVRGGIPSAPLVRTRTADGGELPLRATVSVRGAGGTEARVLVEEYRRAAGAGAASAAVTAPDVDDPDGGARPELVLLSAPSTAHLVATARRLADWLAEQDSAPDGVRDLAAVARELRTGRAAMACRLAVTARDTAQLAAALDGFARDQGDGSSAVRSADLRDGRADPLLLGELPETRTYVTALWQGRRLEQLTRLWLAGIDVTPAGEPAGPVVELPRTALVRRSLWIGWETTPGVERTG
ncbi:beta-ketoacyl synthase N-terminal-like domain-containing protein [Streptomyces monticola]|uniref:Beta-ketoacyl synthase N-terminal-like domain-containing protein n=1 Tax=Streptomyces monticola TaxID=2666263 RepID=A0ABW2JX15_9ACTN